jgi:hypothetical protein
MPLETTNGKLRLFVSSRKVLTRVENYDVSFRTPDGQLHVTRKAARIYERVLDDGQESALRESKELAIRRGMTLEVTDLSRQGALGRISMLVSGRVRGRASPGSGALLGAKAHMEGGQGGCEDVSSPVSRP